MCGLVLFCFAQVDSSAQLVYKFLEGRIVSLLPLTEPSTELDIEEKHFKYSLDQFFRKLSIFVSLTGME